MSGLRFVSRHMCRGFRLALATFPSGPVMSVEENPGWAHTESTLPLSELASSFECSSSRVISPLGNGPRHTTYWRSGGQVAEREKQRETEREGKEEAYSAAPTEPSLRKNWPVTLCRFGKMNARVALLRLASSW